MWDITQHSCELDVWSEKKPRTQGRKAHELYATLAGWALPPDGAAGFDFRGACPISTAQIDPGEVKQKRRAAARHCTFAPAK